MGIKKHFVILALLLAVFVFPVNALAAPLYGDKIVIGDNYILREDETLSGNLLVIGGSVDIREGARVTGNVTQLGGSMRVAGEISGDLTQIGGSLSLEDTAHLYGNLNTNGGSYDRSEGAVIDGQVRTGVREVNVNPIQPRGFGQVILDGLWNLFAMFSAAALAVFIAIIWPKHLNTVGETLTDNPVLTGGVGLLVFGVTIPILILLTITVIMIPLTFVGFVVLAAASLFGWAALSLVTGERIGEMAGRDWSPGVAAGVGGILLGIVFIGVDLIPCIGWAVQFMIGMVGLGAVVLTRFGYSPYSTATATTVSEPEIIEPIIKEPEPESEE